MLSFRGIARNGKRLSFKRDLPRREGTALRSPQKQTIAALTIPRRTTCPAAAREVLLVSPCCWLTRCVLLATGTGMKQSTAMLLHPARRSPVPKFSSSAASSARSSWCRAHSTEGWHTMLLLHGDCTRLLPGYV